MRNSSPQETAWHHFADTKAIPVNPSVNKVWLQQYGLEISTHPSHSHDIVKQDFQLFGPITQCMVGKRFTDDTGLIGCCTD